MKRLIYISLIFCVTLGYSQSHILKLPLDFEYQSEEKIYLDFLDKADDPYQSKLVSGIYKVLSFEFLIRLEDELTSEEVYKILSDVAFFDLNVNYQMGPFNLSWSVENLLEFNNSAFEIEPSLEKAFGKFDRVRFSHEADFRIGAAISYEF